MKAHAKAQRRKGWAQSRALVVFLALAMQGAWAAPKKSTPAPSKPKPEQAKPATPTPAPAAPATPDGTAPSAENRQQAQAIFDVAMEAFQRGDAKTAREGLQKVLTMSPGNVPALLNLAILEQRLKSFDLAERYLRQVLSADQKSASAWLLLGIGAYEQGKMDAACAHLAEAVLYAPKNAQAHQYLGVVLGRKGWYSAGEEELRRAVELDPNQAESNYNLAVLYMERVPPSTELARRHYQRALELGATPDPELAKKLEGQ